MSAGRGGLGRGDLLRVGLALFGLFLAWRFLAEVASTVLLLAQGPAVAARVVLAYVGIQIVESNLLTPLVMQKATSLHPAVVVAVVTAAGAAFGILGALLAVPVAVVGGILVRELWFRRLEGDAPA